MVLLVVVVMVGIGVVERVVLCSTSWVVVATDSAAATAPIKVVQRKIWIYE